VGDNEKDLRISILNAQGRILVDRHFAANSYDKEITILAQYLNSGMYWLSIEVDGNRTVKTIVLEGEE
jgi:hypothetical protein